LQASGRALGVYAVTVLWVLWDILTIYFGNATTPSSMLGLDFPILSAVGITVLVPLTIQLLREWKPVKTVKHRSLVYYTCCATATYTCAVLLVPLLWFFMEQGHAISRMDIGAWTFCAVLGPICVIVLLRPSPWLISAASTLGAALIGALGYYSDSFDTFTVSIVAGITFNLTVHTMWFILENTHRVSFVHQLSAMTESVAAAQAKSEQEKEKAKALDQQKAYQKMVAATAHDLRTASSAMQSGCRVLTALHAAAVREGEDRAKEMKVVQMMSVMAKTSNMFLEGMALSAGLLDGASVPIFMERVNLQQVAEEVIACGKLACSSSDQIEYVLSVDPEIGETVYCDLNCISRNLMNLVSNASKHTAQGSITVHISLDRHRTYIELAVMDTGVGVADEFKQSVFDPFVSMDDSTGLGLYVVRMQSEALGGSCGIRDNPVGPGAEVWFRVPYITSEREMGEFGLNCQLRHLYDPQGGINVFGSDKTIRLRGGEASPHDDGDDAEKRSPGPCWEGLVHGKVGNTHDGGGSNGEPTAVMQQNILLIDDNLSLLEVHAAELTQAGFTVTTALGGVRGLDFLKLKFFSLVLVDVKMPALNGDELVAAFRHWETHNRPDTQHQTFYALSAYTDDPNVQKRCRHVGMEGVVAKPLLIEVIVELMLQQPHNEQPPFAVPS